jgi:two-component system phosphate regulon response regulator PhoB
VAKSILLVHIDRSVRENVRQMLGRAGFDVVESPELRLTDFSAPDVALIDWRVLDPLAESIRWLKQKGSAPALRVIVLANHSEYGEAVRALEFGADDCVSLPLQGNELLVRLNACLARPIASIKADQLSAGPIVLDRSVHKVWIHEQSVDLAPTEFRLLAFLLENQGRVFSRDELLTRAWSRNVKAGHRTVDVHVRRLRQQLEPHRCEEMIQTIRGFGYRLRADESTSRA